METGRRQAQKAVNQASDMVKDVTGKNILNQAQQWYGSAENMVSDVARRSTSLTRRYPLQSLLGAAVIGYICAALFRRTKV